MARETYEVINAALAKENFDWNRARETQATSKGAVFFLQLRASSVHMIRATISSTSSKPRLHPGACSSEMPLSCGRYML